MNVLDPRHDQRIAEEFEARSLVRSFSLDVVQREPENIIAQGLQQVVGPPKAVASREWSSYYQSAEYLAENEEAASLAIESTRLNAEWEKFILTQDAKKKGSAWGGPRPAAGTVTITALKEVVTQAGREWENKDRFAGGKAQKYFHKFCATLNAHSNLLEMLPNQSEYCSIFCGSIKALIQASVNHRKIAEEIAQALVDISEEVEICVSEAKIYPTEEMKKAISELYAHVFQFLRKAMQWYQSKSHHKVLNSFSSDFREKFAEQLKDIQKLSARISRRANIGTMAELRDFKITSEAQSQQTWEEKEHWKRKAETYEMKYEFLKSLTGKAAVGKGMANLLHMQAADFLELIGGFDNVAARGSPSPMRSPPRTVEYAEPQLLMEPPTPGTSLTFLSRDLQDHITIFADPATLIYPSDIFAEHAVVKALQNWTTSTESERLWIIGVPSKYPAPTTSIAASVANAASELGVPFACFCYPTMHTDENTTDEKGIISMLYTLIRQVIDFIPQTVDASQLSAARFQALDGTLKTWEEGLGVLSDVLNIAPPLLLIIIDGLERLDFAECGEHYLLELLSLLQKRSETSNSDGSGNALKLLFTTAGNCAALNDVMDEDTAVLVKCQASHLKKSPGKWKGGRTVLDPFGDTGGDSYF